MKVYDFQKKAIEEMPMIKEEEDFELRLDNNSISILENIPLSCKKLSLSNNKISYLSKRISIDNNLKFLDLSFNRLISLTGFERLFKLKEVNLSNNYIADDQLLFLKSLNNVKILNLSNNNLKTSTICTVIGAMSKLEKLNLANNHLEALQFDSSCENLYHLEVDSNKITSISFTTAFPNLNYLSISNNKLEQIENPHNIKNLEFLIAYDNSILKTDFLKKFHNIRIINLKNNLINKYTYSHSVAKEPIHTNYSLNMSSSNFSNLEVIEMSFNNITEFSLEPADFSTYFTSLKTVLLDNNKLTELKISKAIETMENLDLSHNTLKTPDFLYNCCSLISLSICFNRFNDLQELVHILKQQKVLRELNMIENDFNKDYYNLETISLDSYQCVNDYFQMTSAYTKKKELIDYRAFIIVKIPSVNKLDLIEISEIERKGVLQGIKENPLLCSRSSHKDNATKHSKSSSMKLKKTFKEEVYPAFSDCPPEIKNEEKILIKDENILKNHHLNSQRNINFNPASYNSHYSTVKNSVKNSTKNSVDSSLNHSRIVNVNVFTGNKAAYSSSRQSNLNTQGNNLNYQTPPNKNPLIPPYSQRNAQQTSVYKLIKKTFCRICDKHGYMKLTDFKQLIEELAKIYNLKQELKIMVKEVTKLSNSETNLMQGKIHMQDFSSILKKEKYNSMLEMIGNKLNEKSKVSNVNTSNTSNFSNMSEISPVNDNTSPNICLVSNSSVKTCLSKKDFQNLKQEQEFKKLEMVTSVEEDRTDLYQQTSSPKKHFQNYTCDKKNFIPIQKFPNHNFNNNIPTGRFLSVKNSESENSGMKSQTQSHCNSHHLRTPMLATFNAGTGNQSLNNTYSTCNQNNNNPHNLLNNSQNPLLQSQSIDGYKFDINDKIFLKQFLYIINCPPFPLRFSEANKSIVYDIYSNEKEFMFLEKFLSNYKINENFKLKKFFHLEYFNTIFDNFASYEFIHDNTIFLFYTPYNELVDSFINGNKTLDFEQDQLILEENPLKLIRNFSVDSLVLCALVQSNSATESDLAER